MEYFEYPDFVQHFAQNFKNPFCDFQLCCNFKRNLCRYLDACRFWLLLFLLVSPASAFPLLRGSVVPLRSSSIKFRIPLNDIFRVILKNITDQIAAKADVPDTSPSLDKDSQSTTIVLQSSSLPTTVSANSDSVYKVFSSETPVNKRSSSTSANNIKLSERTTDENNPSLQSVLDSSKVEPLTKKGGVINLGSTIAYSAANSIPNEESKEKIIPPVSSSTSSDVSFEDTSEPSLGTSDPSSEMSEPSSEMSEPSLEMSESSLRTSDVRMRRAPCNDRPDLNNPCHGLNLENKSVPTKVLASHIREFLVTAISHTEEFTSKYARERFSMSWSTMLEEELRDLHRLPFLDTDGAVELNDPSSISFESALQITYEMLQRVGVGIQQATEDECLNQSTNLLQDFILSEQIIKGILCRVKHGLLNIKASESKTINRNIVPDAQGTEERYLRDGVLLREYVDTLYQLEPVFRHFESV